jgi:hypothetical protein
MKTYEEMTEAEIAERNEAVFTWKGDGAVAAVPASPKYTSFITDAIGCKACL